MNEEVIQNEILSFQRREITEHFIYQKIANSTKDKRDKKLLNIISRDELTHYIFWKKKSHRDLKPNFFEVYFTLFFAKILGYVFILRFFINNEKKAQTGYHRLINIYPHINDLLKDEKKHERHITTILNKHHLRYLDSVFVGLDDAVIELLGLLIGLIIVLNDKSVILLIGTIITLSTAVRAGASQYFEMEVEARGHKKPIIAFFYSFLGFFIAATLLLFPFLIFSNIYFSAMLMLFNSFILILFFSYYFSVLKNLSFRKKCRDIMIITYGVALLTFAVSLLIKHYLLSSLH